MARKAALNKNPTNGVKIDTKCLDKALERISLGSPYRLACRAEGFSYSQFKAILAQGELDADHHLLSTQSEIVKKLRSMETNKIQECVEKITSSEKGHTGAQWFLERKHWKDFSSNAAVLQLTAELEEMKEQMRAASKQRGNEDGI